MKNYLMKMDVLRTVYVVHRGAYFLDFPRLFDEAVAVMLHETQRVIVAVAALHPAFDGGMAFPADCAL